MNTDITLVLDQNDLTVKLDGAALHITSPQQPLQRVPLGLLGQMVIHGNPRINCDVWRALAERDIPAILFPARGNGHSAWLSNGLSTAIQIRIKQYSLYQQTSTAIQLARWLLHSKLQAQLNLLTILQQPSPITKHFFQHQQMLLQTQQQRLQTTIGHLPEAQSIDKLLGYEGSAATAWYSTLSTCLPSAWNFNGRNRRPPKDPVNALLSLTYTLVLSEVRRAVQQRGLEPCLGFLHQVLSGRESLVLDLMEAFRAGADLFVLELINSELTPADFTNSAKDGCRLSKHGRSQFYTAWATWRLDWPWQLINIPANKLDNPSPIVINHDLNRTLSESCRWFVNEFTAQWLQSAEEHDHG